MCGSFHLDKALNVEIGVEYQMIFVVVIFFCSQVLQFRAFQYILKLYLFISISLSLLKGTLAFIDLFTIAAEN